MPYIGEIRRFSFDAIPTGWLACDGQVLSADENEALFSVLASTYGGTETEFALPDLRGLAAVGQNGTAGMIGTSGMGSGLTQAYQTLVFAIATTGTFPPRTT